MSGDRVKRRYEAPARRASAQETRARICSAAEALFVRDGYAKTSIRAVAARAGVSEATVYLAFENKARLLDETILRALEESGGSSIAEVLTLPPEKILRGLAESHSLLMERAAHLIAIGEGAAVMDAALRPRRERAHMGLRRAMRGVVEALDAASLLRPGLSIAEATDTLYAIPNDTTYLRLTAGGQRTPAEYASWLAETLEVALLDGDVSTGKHRDRTGG